jgi:hypothetical protein
LLISIVIPLAKKINNAPSLLLLGRLHKSLHRILLNSKGRKKSDHEEIATAKEENGVLWTLSSNREKG